MEVTSWEEVLRIQGAHKVLTYMVSSMEAQSLQSTSPEGPPAVESYQDPDLSLGGDD